METSRDFEIRESPSRLYVRTYEAPAESEEAQNEKYAEGPSVVDCIYGELLHVFLPFFRLKQFFFPFRTSFFRNIFAGVYERQELLPVVSLLEYPAVRVERTQEPLPVQAVKEFSFQSERLLKPF